MPTRARSAHPILYGTLVVGTLDALDAIVFFGLRSGVTPGRIFQSIAAGIYGRNAFRMGIHSIGLGIILHYFIAFLIVAIFYLMSRAIPFMRKQTVIAGIAYGIAAARSRRFDEITTAGFNVLLFAPTLVIVFVGLLMLGYSGSWAVILITAVAGATTFKPGTPCSHGIGDCECIAPKLPPAPIAARTTNGHDACSFDTYQYFAAWLTSESIASSRKSANMISKIGRSPVTAAPKAPADIASSEIGVSMTRRARVTRVLTLGILLSFSSKLMQGYKRLSPQAIRIWRVPVNYGRAPVTVGEAAPNLAAATSRFNPSDIR